MEWKSGVQCPDKNCEGILMVSDELATQDRVMYIYRCSSCSIGGQWNQLGRARNGNIHQNHHYRRRKSK